MKKYSFLILLLATITNAISQPLSLHPENQHYFLYQGKPTILITSAEHYGIVINSALDYKKYLDVLHQYGFNLTRVFCGSYCEGNYYEGDMGKQKKWEENQNTLAVRPGKLLAPWARSDTPGYINGGNKFNLDKWDDSYFNRLKDFCKEAAARNIIVEVVFFSANYGSGTWKNSPLHHDNNINNIDEVAYNEVYLLKNKELINRQLAMVRKIVEEMNNFDNIYFEICNEPYWLKGIPEVEPTIKTQQFLLEIDEWQKLISSVIKETENNLPKRHLIAQNFANKYFKIEKLDTAVSVLNFHYAYPPTTITDNYALNKPVSFDETFDGTNAPNRRREAWAFILAGGAVYDNLDWSFATDDLTGLGRNAAGERVSGKEVREQLQILLKIINSFNFIKAQPLDSSFKQNLPEDVNLYGLGIKGTDYLIYWIKSKILSLDKWICPLPQGDYTIKWIDPMDGKIIQQQTIKNSGKQVELAIPEFSDDRVVRITRE